MRHWIRRSRLRSGFAGSPRRPARPFVRLCEARPRELGLGSHGDSSGSYVLMDGATVAARPAATESYTTRDTTPSYHAPADTHSSRTWERLQPTESADTAQG